MSWDYIVIGAGSAGCAVTHQLVKAGKSVLVLEAGGSDRSPAIKLPAGVVEAMTNYDWGYESQPDPSRYGASEKWVRGRVLGGCSSINGTVFVRGAAEDFDRWANQLKSEGNNESSWTAEEIMPIFREMESSDQAGPGRGHAGPIHVRTVGRPHAVTKSFLQSAVAAGFDLNEDYNGPTQEGVSYAQLTVRRGLRWSAADAFLRPNLRRKNLCLITDALVEKIEIVNGRATSVVFRQGGKRRRETAADIILSAGALNSPKLLMLSGVGDPLELERHSIATVIDLPGVGKNLREHPLVRLVYRSRVPTNNLTKGNLQKLQIAAKFALFREGPIANLWEGAGFLRTRPSETTPDIQLFFTAVGSVHMDQVRKRAPFPAVTVGIIKSHPASSGVLRLASADPVDPPLIECRLLAEQEDVDTLVRGVETIRRIMAAEPMAGILEGEIIPGPDISSSEELGEFIRRNTEVTFHPIGTCRMGLGAGSVVGPDLRVHGTENLWVADASIMPSHMSANINAPCMMIGTKLGKQLASRRVP